MANAAAAAKMSQAMSAAQQLVKKHRAHVVQSHPFFGMLLLKQELIEDRGVPTMATNGRQLFYNPDYVMQQDPAYLRFDIAHEACHPGFGHHVRRGNRDFRTWNEACDYVINPILRQAGFQVPPDALLREDLVGLDAEQAFSILWGEKQSQMPPQQPEEDQPEDGEGDDEGQQDQPQDGQDGEQDGEDAGQDGQEQAQDGEDGSQAGEGQGEGQDGAESGSGGQGSPLDQIPEGWNRGAVLDAPCASEEERQREERDWRTALSQAAAFAKGQAGHLPGDVERELEAFLNPKASWQELLRRFFDQFAREDFSWTSQNRRFVSRGLYLPALKSEQMPPMLKVIDASGSMPQEALVQSCAEIQEVLDTLRPEFLDVLVHDTEVREVIRFEPGDDVKLKVRAGGGTAFAPVCEWIAEAMQEQEYAVVVWFTDLDAWDWEDCIEPEVPVLWLDYDNGAIEPPWGEEVIRMDDL